MVARGYVKIINKNKGSHLLEETGITDWLKKGRGTKYDVT